MEQMLKSKRSQLTIFIIIAIVLVVVLLIVFYPRIKNIFVPSPPYNYLENCISDELKEAVDLVSKRGGSINPVNAIMYSGEKVEYLCYTNEYYKTCTMQVPLLKQHVEREIYDYIEKKAMGCTKNLKKDLERRGYSVDVGKQEISVSVVPNNVRVVLSGISVRKGETGERYDRFEVKIKSSLYNFIMLASSILNWEARYGDSDITTYMLYYPDMKVEKYKQSDGSTIYILSDRKSKDKFVFASRSLAWPAGYGFGKTHKPIVV